MKKFILLLLLAPFSCIAAAPFGLKWGDEFLHFGEAIKTGSWVTVKTTQLPQGNLSAEYYLLEGEEKSGLTKVHMKSFEYTLFSKQLDSDFAKFESSLLDNGFRVKSFTNRNTSSYQCIFQGKCTGRKLEAVHDDGTKAILEVKVKDRDTGYFSLEYFI